MKENFITLFIIIGILLLSACKDGGGGDTENTAVIDFSLAVTSNGNGSGTVTSNPMGLSCGADCVESYSQNTVVTLTAAPDSGSEFAGWNGPADCVDGLVTLTADIICAATFNVITHTLSIGSNTGTGSGRVMSMPAGIDCSTDCSEDYLHNTSVSLTALADVGSKFFSWEGDADCSDGSLTINSDITCNAVFNLLILNQAAFNSSTVTYQYGFNSMENIKITGSPADADLSRWAMLHDGSAYRLYVFKKNSGDTLYQYVYNATTNAYEYGLNSFPVLKIANTPSDADTGSVSMLHDGSFYRLYMRSKTSAAIYQFAFNDATSRYEYGFNSVNKISLTGAPADTDFTRWAMLHDGTYYRFYAFKAGSGTILYQFAFDSVQQEYRYAFQSVTPISLDLVPVNNDASSLSMLHDGSAYRLYTQSK